MTRAIIYVPTVAGYERSAALCLDHARQRGYDLKGIVRDWSAVQRMLGVGEVSVALVADERDLDPARKPRVEVVANQSSPDRFEQRRRCARITRPGEGA